MDTPDDSNASKNNAERLSRLKIELREKLARKKAESARIRETSANLENINTRLGFGGRIINNGNSEAWINSDPQPIAQNASFVGFGSIPSGESQQAPYTSNSKDELTPQPKFILDDQRKVVLTPKAHKAQMRKMKKANEGIAAFKEQKRLRLKAQQKAQRLAKNKTKTDACDRILKNKVIYAVSDEGRQLVPLLDPDVEDLVYVTWNNWRYVRALNGTLKRNVKRSRQYCRYFSRNGICQKGLHCTYVHDLNRVALCRQYVAGKCNGECIFSHERTEFNTPQCRFHLEGTCRNENCRYSHRTPPFSQNSDYSVWTCRPFSVGGWCLRGSSCPFLHLYNCPDFEEIGQCPRGKNCTLTHTITRRLQELMATPQDTSGVVVARDTDSKKLVNSYTVEPCQLFVRPQSSEFYVDQEAENTEADDSQLVIRLQSSEDEDEDEDM